MMFFLGLLTCKKYWVKMEEMDKIKCRGMLSGYHMTFPVEDYIKRYTMETNKSINKTGITNPLSGDGVRRGAWDYRGEGDHGLKSGGDEDPTHGSVG